MLKCSQCGLENMEGTPICRECGATLSLATDAEVADVSADSAAEASPEADDDVLELMRGQKKIAAIKVYRERYQVGLKEAKDAVEALAAKHGIESQGAGCAGVVLLGLMGLAAGAWSLLA